LKTYLDAALSYAKKGLSVIPVRPDKKPFIKWTEFQKRIATSEEIKTWWGKHPKAMIGLVTGAIGGLFVLDCDSEEAYKRIQELLPDALLLPIARTPRGYHLYFLFINGMKLTVGAGIMPGVDFRGEGGYIIAPPSRNGEGKAYSWMPELSLMQVEPPSLPAAMVNILKRSLYRGGVDNLTTPQNYKSISFEQGNRDEALFHLANHLVKSGMPHANILQYLTFFASNSNPPYPQKEISTKIESAIKRFSSRERALSDEVREYVLSTDGHVLSTDVYNSLDVSTRKEKKNVSEILSRLMKDGLIERAGNKNGCFRRINTECDVIDWGGATGAALDIAWPFQLEKKIKIYPKSLATIAGVPNVGKSTLALNMAYMNRDKMLVRYLSSEMAGDELKIRLELFDKPEAEWKKIDFREKSSGFSDVILPDALNIVDYYEIDRDFWTIAGDMKRIYERLKKGIAIICLQKTQGKDAGRGGDFGLEKPRLYLNLDPDPPRGNILTIRKAKSWMGTKNPNWEKIRFKILRGSEIVQVDDWYIEE